MKKTTKDTNRKIPIDVRTIPKRERIHFALKVIFEYCVNPDRAWKCRTRLWTTGHDKTDKTGHTRASKSPKTTRVCLRLSALSTRAQLSFPRACRATRAKRSRAIETVSWPAMSYACHVRVLIPLLPYLARDSASWWTLRAKGSSRWWVRALINAGFTNRFKWLVPNTFVTKFILNSTASFSKAMTFSIRAIV